MFTFLAFYWRIIYYSLTFTSIRLNQKAYLNLENRCWIQISSGHLNQHVASFLKQKISEICLFFWRYSRWGGRWSWRWCCSTCCCCRPGRWCVAAGGTGAAHQWSQSSQTPSQVTCLGRSWVRNWQTLKWDTSGIRCRVMSEASFSAATQVLNIPLKTDLQMIIVISINDCLYLKHG